MTRIVRRLLSLFTRKKRRRAHLIDEFRQIIIEYDGRQSQETQEAAPDLDRLLIVSDRSENALDRRAIIRSQTPSAKSDMVCGS
jgi:hypothetical protein